MAGTELPLAGVRVVEMTHMVMGPTCGMILAQLGAEVMAMLQKQTLDALVRRAVAAGVARLPTEPILFQI